MGKLPVKTRKNLARDHSNCEWSLNELQDAILKEIHIIETGLNIVNQHKQNPPTPTASFHTMLAETHAQPMILQIVKGNILVFTVLDLMPHPSVM